MADPILNGELVKVCAAFPPDLGHASGNNLAKTAAGVNLDEAAGNT